MALGWPLLCRFIRSEFAARTRNDSQKQRARECQFKESVMQSLRGRQWRLATMLILVFCAYAAVAQTQFGTITGRVTDKTGAVVVDATVTLTDTATQTSKAAKTGAEGTYTFAALVPSNYKLAVAKEGFTTVQKTLTVTPADRLTEDFLLAVGN